MTEQEDTYKVRGKGQRHYYIQLPWLIDDSDLGPHALALYIHLATLAYREGDFDATTRELAEHCKMSTFSVSRAKQELIDAGLIEVSTSGPSPTSRHVITLVDVWEKNEAKYLKAVSNANKAVSNANKVLAMLTATYSTQTLKDSASHTLSILSDSSEVPTLTNSDSSTNSGPSTVPKPLDPVDHLLDRSERAKANRAETTIRTWSTGNNEHLIDICIDFVRVFEIPVTARDKGKWLKGAADVHALGTEMQLGHGYFKRLKDEHPDLKLTCPGAAYEWLKGLGEEESQGMSDPL